MFSRFSLAVSLCIALFPQSSFSGTPNQLGPEATSTSGKDPAMSEREKAGLRGPVERCTEQRVSPAVGGIPEMKFSDTTEYDPEGRILRTSNTNPDGSKWVRTNTYDSQGRLLKTISEIAGRSAEETTYSYDEVGRIIGIT